jgi:hypothetical protein
MPDPTRDRSDGADLGARLRAIAAWGDPGEVPDPAHLRASTIDLLPLRAGRSFRRWVPLAAAAAAVAVVVGIIAVTAPRDDDIDVGGGSGFASAIDASGVLTSPSVDEVEQAMDRDHYKPDTGQTQVSAAGNYVSLRTCRLAFGPNSPCSAGWAYKAGTADGDEVHRGLLGEANDLELHVLDDRYFVATESAPDTQAPPAAWLIDAVSGKAGALNWHDEPTTLRSPGQALLVCDEDEVRLGQSYDRQCFLPRVVDARDGTIQPLAVPDHAVLRLPVAQHGDGRIWVGTAPDGDLLGLAFTDDGGETWTEVALPEQLRATSEELATSLSVGDKLLEIAADGDRVAVTYSWGWGDRETTRDELYLSDDAGRSWTTPTSSDPGGNGAHLYVLADGRLVLLWSTDAMPVQVLVSTGSDWAALEKVDAPWDEDSLDYADFSVNRAGIAFSYSFFNPCEVVGAVCDFPAGTEEEYEWDITIDFSTDLTNWWTIEGLDD